MIAVSLTACGKKNKNDSSEIVKKQPVNTTDSEDNTSPEDTEATEAEDEAPKADDKVVIDIEDPTEDSSGTEQDKPTSLFTFKADEDIWNVEQDENSASIIYNGDDVQFAKGNCTILINTREIEDMADRTLGEVADAIVDSKGLSSSIVVNDRGESVLGGQDAYTLECTYTVGEVKFDLDITVMADGIDVVEVWVMSYEECTDAMQKKFDEVLKTIKFGD